MRLKVGDRCHFTVDPGHIFSEQTLRGTISYVEDGERKATVRTDDGGRWVVLIKAITKMPDFIFNWEKRLI